MLRTVDETEHISEDYQVEFYDYEKTLYGSTSNPDADVNTDLNQNDPLAKGYIKNRTHYTDDDGTVHVLDEKYLSTANANHALEKLSKCNIITPVQQNGTFYTSPDGSVRCHAYY